MPNLKLLVDKDNRNHVIDADEVMYTKYECPDDPETIIVYFIMKGDKDGICSHMIYFASQDAANLELSKLIDA